jgi:hypothetical protein
MTSTLTPQLFYAKWRRIDLNERAVYQSHFNELCALLNHPTPTDYDHTGENFRFEKGATKSSGGEGFADVWFKGHFAWEYKGKHANSTAKLWKTRLCWWFATWTASRSTPTSPTRSTGWKSSLWTIC